jgi:hypothetical protein
MPILNTSTLAEFDNSERVTERVAGANRDVNGKALEAC